MFHEDTRIHPYSKERQKKMDAHRYRSHFGNIFFAADVLLCFLIIAWYIYFISMRNPLCKEYPVEILQRFVIRSRSRVDAEYEFDLLLFHMKNAISR